MRDKLLQLTDVLDFAFMSPLGFIDAWEKQEISWVGYGRVFAILSAFSLAVGTSYISPPYTSGYIFPIILSTFANFAILILLPTIFGSLIDYFAQSKQRTGKAIMLRDFGNVSLSLFMLYAPICMILQAIGFTGLAGAFFAMITMFGFYLFVCSRGVKYIHDLKDSDAIRYSSYALGLSFFYPFLFNFYMTSFILNFTL
ncbi:hypothetical protein [Leptospira sp. GIMC2001]|uniref:hypothetical protein n=1 Tax=Leptospira sp. GIMC2001 TaxID=1513297 RepID=UPI00234B356A|nr:hypothetical protein [Leptospira sp. GIMC2001]WCL50336.1 hypothetical protein O4O04_05820 [Leptospira sp. GIMC2001]